jgi:hypothetical protein
MKTSPGVEWRLPFSLERIILARIGDPAPANQHPIYGLSSITGSRCIEADPVENLGAREAIVSKHASTWSTIYKPTQPLEGRLTKED